MEENVVTAAGDILVPYDDVNVSSERSPEVIAKEINFLLARTKQNFIEIGNLLLEAREQVKHGEWESWLKENVSFSRYTAHKFMQVSLRFSNVASTQHFNSAQMFELLALPKKHTDDFFEEKDRSGVDLEKLTEKELRQEVKAWKEKFRSPRKNNKDVASDTTTEKNSAMVQSIEKFFSNGLTLIGNEKFFDSAREYAISNPEQTKNDIEKIIQALQSINNSI